MTPPDLLLVLEDDPGLLAKVARGLGTRAHSIGRALVSGEAGVRVAASLGVADIGLLPAGSPITSLGNPFLAEWASAFSRLPLLDGKDLREGLSLDGASLWYYLRLVLQHSMEDLGDLASALSDAGTWASRPSRTLVATSSAWKLALCKAAARDRGCDAVLVTAVPATLPAAVGRRLAWAKWCAYHYAIGAYQSYQSWKHGRAVVPRRPGKKLLLAFTGGLWGDIGEPEGRPRKGNLYFYPLFDALAGELDIVDCGVTAGRPREYLRRIREQARGEIPHETADGELSAAVLLESWRSAQRVSRLLRRTGWGSPGSPPPVDSPVRMLGIDATEAMQKMISVAWDRQGLAIVAYLLATGCLMRRLKPDLAITVSHSDIWGRSLAIWGRRLGVPVLELNHGSLVAGRMVVHHNEPQDVSETGDWRAPFYSFPHLFLCGSRNTESVFRDHLRLPASALVLTGEPRYDSFKRRIDSANSDELRRRLGLPARGPIVCFATGPVPDVAERTLGVRIVLEACERIPGCHLIVKVHPRESEAFYRDGLKPSERLTIAGPQTPVPDVLAVSTVVAAACSTVLMEALLVRRRAVIVDPKAEGYHAFYGDHPAIHSVAGAGQLAALLGGLIEERWPASFEPIAADFLERYCYQPPEGATARIVEEIRSVLARGPAPVQP